jgi:hypothetical protein
MVKTITGTIYNLYCDESCHLLNDRISIMGFGAIIVPEAETRRHSIAIKKIKGAHNCNGELKWSKVSNKNIGFYIDIVNYFFSNSALGFRSLIVHNKNKLQHTTFNQGSHEVFYYKMYYELIKAIPFYHPDRVCKVYLDEKDTRGCLRVHKLEEILLNFLKRSTGSILRIQEIKSRESNMVQLTDFFLGAVTYANRGLTGNNAKNAIIKRIKELSGYSLKYSTEPWESKFNLFHFYPREI